MCASDRTRPPVRRLLQTPAALGALALVVALVGAWPAYAQQAPSREQEQIRRLRQQVQQLQTELSQSRQAQAQAAQQAQASQTRLDAAGAAQQRAQSALATRGRELQTLQQQFAEVQKQQATLQAELSSARSLAQGTQADLQSARAEQAQLRRVVAGKDSDLADLEARRRLQARDLRSCVLQRQALDDLSVELLSRVAHRPVLTAVFEEEPFLQFGRVQQQNIVQGYETRLRSLRSTAPDGDAAATPAETAR